MQLLLAPRRGHSPGRTRSESEEQLLLLLLAPRRGHFRGHTQRRRMPPRRKNYPTKLPFPAGLLEEHEHEHERGMKTRAEKMKMKKELTPLVKLKLTSLCRGRSQKGQTWAQT